MVWQPAHSKYRYCRGVRPDAIAAGCRMRAPQFDGRGLMWRPCLRRQIDQCERSGCFFGGGLTDMAMGPVEQNGPLARPSVWIAPKLKCCVCPGLHGARRFVTIGRHRPRTEAPTATIKPTQAENGYGLTGWWCGSGKLGVPSAGQIGRPDSRSGPVLVVGRYQYSLRGMGTRRFNIWGMRPWYVGCLGHSSRTMISRAARARST
jgi:hypothetical protein